MGRGVDRNDRSLVDVLVLHINRMVILVVVIDLRVEDTSYGHIKALAFIVTRRTSNGRATRGAALRKGTHAGNLRTFDHRWAVDGGGVMGTLVHILVLQVDGVVILAPLVDLGVDLDIGRVGANEATVAIISRGPANSGATTMMGWVAMLLLCN